VQNSQVSLPAPLRQDLAHHGGAGGACPAVERAVQRAGELFQRLPLRPKITLNEDGSPSFEFTAAHGTTDIDQTIDRLGPY